MPSWPSFLSPWWGLLGLLAVPLVLLYLLRQKHPVMPIGSTLLWQRVLQDLHASRPFQKLRRNLLLLIQLFILAALVITLMRPVVQAAASSATAGVIVLDATASMQSTDGDAQGHTRLAAAQAQAHKLVDSMRAGDRYMLLSDGGGLSPVHSGFTDNKTELHRLIDQVRPSDTASDLSETMLLAATSLKAIGGADHHDGIHAGAVYLFSDGAGVQLPRLDQLAAVINFIRIGTADENVGIVRLAVTPLPKEKNAYDVFVGLANSGPHPRQVSIGLAYGRPDNFLSAQQLTLPPRGQGAATFEHVVQPPGRIYVRVAPADQLGDVLPLDNTAYALLEPARPVRVVLVSTGDPTLERFIQTADGTGLLTGQMIAPQFYQPDTPADLFIFDQMQPAVLPKADALFIAPRSNVAGFEIAGTITRPPLVRWKRDDPLMAYLELEDLRIEKASRIEPDAEMTEVMMSSQGPLLAYKDAGSLRHYVLAFSPGQGSNWWHNYSHVMFLKNLVDQTRARHFIGRPQVISTGQVARLWDLSDRATLTLPDGKTAALKPRDGAAEYAGTDQVGFYSVSSGDRIATFAVNLMSPAESNITPRALTVPGGLPLTETASITSVNKEIWPWVALAGLVLLVGEWLVYHRRLA